MSFFDDDKEAFAIATLGGKGDTHSVFFASIEVESIDGFDYEVSKRHNEYGFMTDDEVCEILDNCTTRVQLPEGTMLIAIQNGETKEKTYGLVDFYEMADENETIAQLKANNNVMRCEVADLRADRKVFLDALGLVSRGCTHPSTVAALALSIDRKSG